MQDPSRDGKDSIDLGRILMRIKKVTNNHTNWMERDRKLQTFINTHKQKIHTTTYEDFERKDVLESMSNWKEKLDTHIDERFLGIKRRVERSREKHKRVYGQSWKGVSADRRLSFPTQYGDSEEVSIDYESGAMNLTKDMSNRRRGNTRLQAHYTPILMRDNYV